MNIGLVLRTVAHLRPAQVLFQVLRRVHKARFKALACPSVEVKPMAVAGLTVSSPTCRQTAWDSTRILLRCAPSIGLSFSAVFRWNRQRSAGILSIRSCGCWSASWNIICLATICWRTHTRFILAAHILKTAVCTAGRVGYFAGS